MTRTLTDHVRFRLQPSHPEADRFRGASGAVGHLILMAPPTQVQPRRLRRRYPWAAGAYGVFLVLATLVPLAESSRLTFERLGLALGETALAILAMALFGAGEPSVRLLSSPRR